MLERITRLVDSRRTVGWAAVLAVVLRAPGMTRPIRPDEAGFLLVARTWDPRPDNVFGHYFVDRPPLLIAFFRLGDQLGGILTIRVVGALACATMVLLAAVIGREVAGTSAGRWAAVVAAALTTNPLIDPIAVKGEILALPFVAVGIIGALRALATRSVAWAAVGGLASATAIGFKQSFAGGLVFGAALLLAAWATHRVRRGDVLRLGAAALAGAAVPVLATVAWAAVEGVRLGVLEYAVIGFRADATETLSHSTSTAPVVRALLLAAVAVGAGVLLIAGGFLVHARGEWRDDPALTVAIVVLLAFDLTSLVGSGSFWTAYLYELVPFSVLAVARLSRRPSRPGRRMRAVVGLSAVSAAVSLAGWIGLEAAHLITYGEAETGRAVGAAAQPGDSLTVFGGRADLQYTSGLPSPYEHLWSLPMRTMDPDYADLRAVLAGPDAPTWLVRTVGYGAWDAPAGPALEAVVDEHYVRHGTGCGGFPVYLRRGVERPDLVVHCVDSPLPEQLGGG